MSAHRPFFLPADPMAQCLRCAWLGRVEDLQADEHCPACGSLSVAMTEPAEDELPTTAQLLAMPLGVFHRRQGG